MPHPLVAIFSLLVAAAGWFYMFYSRAAENLSAIEDQRLNTLRRRLRRIGGFCMFLLAIGFFAGFKTVDEHTATAFVLIWMSVLILLLVIVILALIDLRLTWKLKSRRRE